MIGSCGSEIYALVTYLASVDFVVIVGVWPASLASVADGVFGAITFSRDNIAGLPRMSAYGTF